MENTLTGLSQLKHKLIMHIKDGRLESPPDSSRKRPMIGLGIGVGDREMENSEFSKGQNTNLSPARLSYLQISHFDSRQS